MRSPGAQLSAQVTGASASLGEREAPPRLSRAHCLTISASSAQWLTGITSTLQKEKLRFRKGMHQKDLGQSWMCCFSGLS